MEETCSFETSVLTRPTLLRSLACRYGRGCRTHLRWVCPHPLRSVGVNIVTNGRVVWLINTWVFRFIGHLPPTTLRIIIYSAAIANSRNYSQQSTITLTESSWSAAPHWTSGTGFQRRTLAFLLSRTVSATQAQQCSTHSALTGTRRPVR
jgi:hypothetical protein